MDVNKNGSAQAALLASMIGCLTLSLVNLGTELSSDFKAWVHAVGKLWIPGAGGIGPYSGKETIALLGWLLSWGILHLILKNKEWNRSVVTVIFLVGMAISTTLLWPPIFMYLGGHH